MIARVLKFVVKIVLTLVVLGALIGFAVARFSSSPRPAAVVSPTPIPWGILITVGNPAVPIVPSAPPQPAPPAPVLPPPPIPTPTASPVTYYVGLADPVDGSPLILEINSGDLFVSKLRNDSVHPELVVQNVASIIAANTGWREHYDGQGWDPILTVVYQDLNGSTQVFEFNTRGQFR